jgi:hypothetical protein
MVYSPAVIENIKNYCRNSFKGLSHEISLLSQNEVEQILEDQKLEW